MLAWFSQQLCAIVHHESVIWLPIDLTRIYTYIYIDKG